MRKFAEVMIQQNAVLIESLGHIKPEEVDGSYLSWLRLFHGRYPSPGMKEAMVMATNAILTNKELPVGEKTFMSNEAFEKQKQLNKQSVED